MTDKMMREALAIEELTGLIEGKHSRVIQVWSEDLRTVLSALSTKQEEPPPNDAREAAHRVRNCDYGMVDEDDARLVAFAYLSTKQEAGEVRYTPPIGTGKKPHGVVTVEAGEVSRSQTAHALEDELMRQYEAHPEWDEAKDVIEGLDCAAILAALSLPAPDAGWRTIDSAPKDGTWFLWWGDGYTQCVIRWPEYRACFADGYWLPLPAPPVGDGSSLA